MHARLERGYDATMTSVDTSHPGFDWTVTTCEELVDLIRAQHEELQLALSRLPGLDGAAREDEFLQVRRRLAVHEALEAVLVSGRLPGDAAPDPADSHAEVVAVEQLPRDGVPFEQAVARLLATHLRHAEVQEHSVLKVLGGELTPAERAVAGTAVSLWHGEGEAYLGNTFGDMVETAKQQLEAAPEPGHVPPADVAQPAPRTW